MDNVKGTVEHERIIKDGLQRDIFTTRIPLECVDDDGLGLLNYWGVEDFDFATISREDGEFVLMYKVDHFLPDGYEE